MNNTDIENILAFIDDDESSSPDDSINDFKVDAFLEKEHLRLTSLDNLISKKIHNIHNYSQTDYLLDLQNAQKSDYKAILKKLLIEEGYLGESKLGKLWNSIFS